LKLEQTWLAKRVHWNEGGGSAGLRKRKTRKTHIADAEGVHRIEGAPRSVEKNVAVLILVEGLIGDILRGVGAELFADCNKLSTISEGKEMRGNRL
jgi:hypothetical protein